MLGLGFQDKKLSRSNFRATDDSPNSAIFTLESNFSLSSSTSGSADRCSFASDVHDREALVSEISKHLAGCEQDHRRCSDGPDLDPSRPRTVNKNSLPATKGEKAKEREKEEETETEDDNQTLDSPQNSFSQALKGTKHYFQLISFLVPSPNSKIVSSQNVRTGDSKVKLLRLSKGQGGEDLLHLI
ncbi:hypothetical protein NE237_018328 [Protea cynaroides]|uniref:Uncharacterized protein n=1 Tax=Protea cynaroides TaxID=273540 RepID=A0A9Q0QP25_9MAGN|nr:hypothetical protein NE237_018328 [Protea cynaroides]